MSNQNPTIYRGRLLRGLLSGIVVSIVLVVPNPGAAKGLVLITHGDDISHVADIPPQLVEAVKQSTRATKPAIGYKYGAVGIFSLNLWTWGGEYVVYENSNYWDLGAEGAAQMLGVGVGDLPKPMTYILPPALIILVILGLGFLSYVFVLRQ